MPPSLLPVGDFGAQVGAKRDELLSGFLPQISALDTQIADLSTKRDKARDESIGEDMSFGDAFGTLLSVGVPLAIAAFAGKDVGTAAGAAAPVLQWSMLQNEKENERKQKRADKQVDTLGDQLKSLLGDRSDLMKEKRGIQSDFAKLEMDPLKSAASAQATLPFDIEKARAGRNITNINNAQPVENVSPLLQKSMKQAFINAGIATTDDELGSTPVGQATKALELAEKGKASDGSEEKLGSAVQRSRQVKEAYKLYQEITKDTRSVKSDDLIGRSYENIKTTAKANAPGQIPIEPKAQEYERLKPQLALAIGRDVSVGTQTDQDAWRIDQTLPSAGTDPAIGDAQWQRAITAADIGLKIKAAIARKGPPVSLADIQFWAGYAAASGTMKDDPMSVIQKNPEAVLSESYLRQKGYNDKDIQILRKQGAIP